MDTFKDRQDLEEMWGKGNAPWLVSGKAARGA
jgi:hypothetical protein